MAKGRVAVQIVKGKKKCSKCKRNRLLKYFAADKTVKCGYSSWCKNCKSPLIEDWNQSKEKNEESRKKQKHSSLKFLYGLSEYDYNQMLSKQHNKCAICSNELTTKVYVDHCHTTGKVRGLLCFNCNIGLGHFKDDAQLLMGAVKYLHQNS